MPESTDNRRIFTLLEVTTSIQKTLSERYSSAFWVKAEMNRLNPHPPSGHCYPELVEKREGRIIAEINANLWKDDYQRINNQFLQVLKEPLKSGITILFLAKVVYDPVYGLRLRIMDIDPAYSLGELERERQETIDRLRKEGIYGANRSLDMPLLPKRIAIISVETSKGYSDFIQTIGRNDWGYRFFYMLFPAILQGERSAASIIRQLRRIRTVLPHFDAVAIIRGGGGEVGLTCYNNYSLCREIALFPIPVITGIGHSTNETVAEMVAFSNAITPTDLADYLLQLFHNYAVPVQRAREKLASRSLQLIQQEKTRLLHTGKYFRSVTGNLLIRRHHEIRDQMRSLRQEAAVLLQSKRQQVDQAGRRMADRMASFFSSEQRELVHMERTIALLDPRNVLKRGYSITQHAGRLVTRPQDLQEGDVLTTILAEGEITSIVAPAPAPTPAPASVGPSTPTNMNKPDRP